MMIMIILMVMMCEVDFRLRNVEGLLRVLVKIISENQISFFSAYCTGARFIAPCMLHCHFNAKCVMLCS
jgi:hypothetical protein